MKRKLMKKAKANGGVSSSAISKHLTTKYKKRLTQEEETALAHRIQQGDIAAREVLVMSNLPLVLHVARRIRGSLPLEDKIQEGVTGLILAAKRFIPERGLRFGTFAFRVIWQSISRAIANQARTIRVPAKMQLRLHRIQQEAEHLSNQLGRNPTLEELGRQVGISAEKLSQYRRLVQLPVSLSALPRERSSDSGDGIKSQADSSVPKSPEDEVISESMRSDVVSSLRVLDEREKYMVTRRFGLDGGKATTLKEIGKDVGLSRERIRQIVERALRKIRESDVGKALINYV